MAKKQREFIEELIDQVPREKRERFKQLVAMERYQYSAKFRFIFHGVLFFVSLPLTFLFFTLVPSLYLWLETFLIHPLAIYGVFNFLQACLWGSLTSEMPKKMNQAGLHAMHILFILGSLVCGGFVIYFIGLEN